MKKYLYLITICGLLVSELAFSQQKKAGSPAQKPSGKHDVPNGVLLPADPQVKVGKLSNGLVYYIRKNTEPKNRAELYLATRVGSLMEEDSQQGLAHFTEHMAFNGTTDFPKNEIINYLQKAGVRFGADLNAYTGFNQTVYQLPIPTDTLELFYTGFKILANWAGKISLNGEDIDNERGVIIEEDRQRGKNAQQRMSQQLLPLLLANSRYANRLPIGKVEILNSFTHDKIRSFYEDWYRPNLQAVIAVGDFDVNEVEKQIILHFEGLQNPKQERPRLHYTLPDHEQPIVKIVTDVEQPYTVAQIFYRQESHTIKTSSDFKKNLMISMINSMLANRLREITNKGTAPFLFAQAGYAPFQGGLVWGYSAFSVIAVAKDASSLEAGLTGAVAEAERMSQFGFSASELNIAKKNLEASNEKRYKEKDKTASSIFVQKYLNHFLESTAMPSIEFEYELMKKELEAISLEELNSLAKTLLSKKNQIVIITAPEKEKANLPTEESVLKAFKNAGNGLTAYVDEVLTQPLLSQIPKEGGILKETTTPELGITTLSLSNGVKVILKPTDFKNDQVIFTSFAKGGSSIAGNDDYISAENASIISQSGVSAYNPSQLSKFLAGNTASVGSYIGSEYHGFSGSSAPKDLETAFQLIHAYATQPRKDIDLFRKNISDSKVIIANKNANPSSVFEDTVKAVLANFHPRGMPHTLADIDKIDLDKAFAFYKERFADVSGQTFVFVGNFETDQLKPLIRTYLASLPSSGRDEQFVDNGIYPPKGKIKKTVYKGIEDKAAVELFFHGDYEYNPSNNLQLDALKSALEIKILERLREKESGVYSPSVQLSIQKEPYQHYYIIISFNCAKANVDKLIAASLDEVQQFIQNGATKEDIQKYTSETIRQQELNLRNNGYWLNYLTTRTRNGEEMNLILQQKERLKKVTQESTKESARRYLNGENFIQFVLLPEK